MWLCSGCPAFLSADHSVQKGRSHINGLVAFLKVIKAPFSLLSCRLSDTTPFVSTSVFLQQFDFVWQKLYSGIIRSLKPVHLYLYLVTLILLWDSWHVFSSLTNCIKSFKNIYSMCCLILDKQNILILKKRIRIPFVT